MGRPMRVDPDFEHLVETYRQGIDNVIGRKLTDSQLTKLFAFVHGAEFRNRQRKSCRSRDDSFFSM